MGTHTTRTPSPRSRRRRLQVPSSHHADLRQNSHRQDHHPRGGRYRHHRPSKPRYKTKKASPPTSSVSSSLANNLKMAALSRTITSKRNQPFTWCCVFVAVATKASLCVELTPQCSPPPTMGVSRPSWLHTPRTKGRNRSSNLSTHYQFVAHARARHRSWYRQGKADHDFSAVNFFVFKCERGRLGLWLLHVVGACSFTNHSFTNKTKQKAVDISRTFACGHVCSLQVLGEALVVREKRSDRDLILKARMAHSHKPSISEDHCPEHAPQ